MKYNAGDKKVVPHDGHVLPNGKTGLPHYQKKSGDGSHVLYGTIPVATANSESNSSKETIFQISKV